MDIKDIDLDAFTSLFFPKAVISHELYGFTMSTELGDGSSSVTNYPIPPKPLITALLPENGDVKDADTVALLALKLRITNDCIGNLMSLADQYICPMSLQAIYTANHFKEKLTPVVLRETIRFCRPSWLMPPEEKEKSSRVIAKTIYQTAERLAKISRLNCLTDNIQTIIGAGAEVGRLLDTTQYKDTPKSLDTRVTNRIFVAVEASGDRVSRHLTFGTTILSSKMKSQVSESGITYQPVYSVINHLPILGVIDVEY